MSTPDRLLCQTLHFSINQWQHLYSLQQAIKYEQQRTGNRLVIQGQIHNEAFLQNHNTAINIEFLQSDSLPEYKTIRLQAESEPTPVLAQITLTESLSAEIIVNRDVFEELRKNLLEYADIDGIHIVVTLGVASNDSRWKAGESLPLVTLDYAMKGDA